MWSFSRFLFAISFLIGLSGCSTGQSEKVVVVDAAKVKHLMSEGILVVDVRTPKEYESGRISGAVPIDFLAKDFKDKIAGLDKTKPVIIYCGVGGRSKKATDIMSEMGFHQIYDYQGGFSDWSAKGEEIER